jgi:large conductance mechanosensitive channel
VAARATAAARHPRPEIPVMWKDFKTFLIKQNALALALAVVIGVALNRVVQAFVNDLIMPIVTVATPSGDWEKAIWQLGSIKFGVGDLMSALLNFLIIGFVAWRISKIVAPEPASPRLCQFCKHPVDAAATRCGHCTSQLG